MQNITGHLTTRQIIFMVIAESRGVARRFIFFVLCIAIGVGAVMTIKSFSNLLKTAISAESKGLLAADIEIKGSWEQSEEDKTAQKNFLPDETDFLFIKGEYEEALEYYKASLVHARDFTPLEHFWARFRILNYHH